MVETELIKSHFWRTVVLNENPFLAHANSIPSQVKKRGTNADAHMQIAKTMLDSI